MKKNEIFTFTAPNGVEVTAVVISVVDATLPCKIDRYWTERRMLYTCYGQNRLFTMTTKIEGKLFCKEVGNPEYGEVIVDYAILPEYDVILENYYHQHKENVKVVQGFGYTKAEASNILEGKNADGSDFEKLPF